ncbi:hypothetical protein [Nocardia sp. NPDC058666]|uniref:hypothetical protein n=1 Tax=unclassified Nocardia TaxID=2637762 RepID=UPI003655C700
MTAAIQNVTADLTVLARQRPDGFPQWRATVRDLSLAGRVLHEQAVAIGVPQTWIEHARHAGRLGQKSTAEAPLPPSTEVPRIALVAQLRHQVDTLYTLAAIGAVRRGQGHVHRASVERLREHVTAQWLRVAMVATALDVTENEVEGWWATDSSTWQPRLALLQAQVEPERGRQWRAFTQPGAVREARCRVEAMRVVGINVDDGSPHQLPPTRNLLEATAENVWQSQHAVETAAGARIGAAIVATGIDDAPHFGLDDPHDLPPPSLSQVLHAESEP